MSDDLHTDEGEPVDPVTGEIGEPTKLPDGWSAAVEQAAVERFRSTGRPFDLDAALKESATYKRKQDQALGSWWAWCNEYQAARVEEVRAHSDFERKEGAIVFRLRSHGEKSAEVARMRAVAEYDDVFAAKLAYRLAEARKDVADKHMRRLSAMLDDLRTQEANKRAMHAHTDWAEDDMRAGDRRPKTDDDTRSGDRGNWDGR
jgi:hypothetical protein